MLAEGHRLTGAIEKGQQALDAAFAVSQATGECTYEAELWRAKGKLILKQSRVQDLASSIKNSSKKVQRSKSQKTNPQSLTPDPQGEAEACFLKAIEIAQHQQAKSWELRASTSLARLWQQQSKQKEAHKLLAEIYGWFTEGFDTADLKEAKALLEELS
jgi:adenylate cyclase